MAHPIYNQNLGLIGILAQSGTPTDCIVFTGESSDFTLTAKYKEWDGTVEYCTDVTPWTVWDGTAISSSNKKLYLRGRGNTTFYTSSGTNFYLSAKAGCSGNLNTLLEYSNPPTTLSANYCYYNMFSNCTNLTTAPELPATTLTNSCYNGMFYGCTSLTTVPALPATTLANNCYSYMFCGCTSLTTAPALPATTLANNCYSNMFMNCTNLKISSSKTGSYQYAWRIPTSGTISSEASNWNTTMLLRTGGTFTSDPSINTTYYGAWTVVETYNISYNLTNCTGASSNPTTIDEGTTTTLSFVSNDGYSFPDTITVSGVESYTWDKSTGTLTLTNATSDVSITITCIVVYHKINSFTYHGKQINNINGKPIRYVHYMGNTYEMVYELQLATPQNVTANGTTVSWDEVENATSYEIYADGVSIGTVSVQSGETWLLNETLNSTELYTQNINFQSGGESFTELKYLNDDAGGYSLFFGDKNVARTIIRTGVTEWYYSENRTIAFETAPTGNLLTWLQANATKQGTSTPTLISFTIDGTSYQAEEGMTWVDWVASSYNTGGFYVTAGNTGVMFSNQTDYVSSEGFPGDFANNTSQIIANGTYYKFSSGSGN